MTRETIIEQLKQVIDTHRKEAHITCPETCWCWDIESVMISLEARLPPAEGAEVNVLFKARRLDTGDWVTGFFTKKKIGNLICPVIEVYKEWDSGDYMESYEIDGKTLISLHAQRLAEKMVSERLRKELIKFYLHVDNHWALGMLTDKVDDVINEYLKTRDR